MLAPALSSTTFMKVLHPWTFDRFKPTVPSTPQLTAKLNTLVLLICVRRREVGRDSLCIVKYFWNLSFNGPELKV